MAWTREQNREYMRRWKADNPDKVAAQQLRYRTKHREKLRQYQVDRDVKLRAAKRKWIQEHLATHPCVDCGESDARWLEFDHVRGVKRWSISAAVRSRVSFKRMVEEVAKCDVRCIPCHRQATVDRGRAGFRTPKALAMPIDEQAGVLSIWE